MTIESKAVLGRHGAPGNVAGHNHGSNASFPCGRLFYSSLREQLGFTTREGGMKVSPWWIGTVVMIGIALVSILLPALAGGAWSPTPMRAVRSMLRTAGLRHGEVLYDLGAGDGRIILTAAREFGATSVGVEIDPLRYAFARARLLLAGVSGRASIVLADFFRIDLRAADVVTLYLSQAANNRLRAKLEAELRPGARVVCYRRRMDGWDLAASDPRYGVFVYVVNGQTGGNVQEGT